MGRVSDMTILRTMATGRLWAALRLGQEVGLPRPEMSRRLQRLKRQGEVRAVGQLWELISPDREMLAYREPEEGWSPNQQGREHG